MKNQLQKIFTLLAIASLLTPLISLADESPAMPRSFYGTVRLNGQPVAKDSTIKAYCGTSTNPSGTKNTLANSVYGAVDPDAFNASSDSPLTVSGCDKTIYFTLTTVSADGIKANQSADITNYGEGNHRLDLTFNVPTAPTITSIAADNKINDSEKAAIHVVGTAEANSLVSVTLSDGTNSKTGTQQLTGGATAFDITIDGTTAAPAALADGTITPSVTATDAAGNVSAAATTPTATKDTAAPTFTIAYYTDETLTTPLANNYMKVGTYYIKITSNEPLTAAPTIDIAAEGSANDINDGVTTLVSGNDYKYTRTITFDALAIGSVAEVIQITGTDSAGNTATNANVDGEKYTDTVAPNAPVISTVTTDDVINIAERDAGVTVTGTTEAGTTVTLNGISATVDGDNWSYALTPVTIDGFGQGGETLTAVATDVAGNTSEGGTKNITVDTVAPTQTVSGVDISTDTGSSNSDFITNTAAQTITGTLSAELAEGDILYGSVDNGNSETWDNITGKVTGTAISWDGATLSGSSTILFKITDAAGNDSATTGAQAYTLDTVAPTVGDDYASNGSLVHTNQTITLSASGGNGSLTIKYCFGNNCVPATLYSTPLVFTTNQDTVVRYQANDSAGNLSEIKGFTLKIIKYDINGGGKVDLADFSVMMSVWGKAANYSDNAFKSDLNADNSVNLADFSILMANWGKEN